MGEEEKKKASQHTIQSRHCSPAVKTTEKLRKTFMKAPRKGNKETSD